MLKALSAAVLATALVGCASTPYQPVPPDYTGPVAVLADSVIPEDSSKARIFAVSQIDGNSVRNSFTASAQASAGQGFSLTAPYVERKVPIKTMKVLLRASHTTAAPIQAIFSQMAGTFHSVEGMVDFTPKPNGRYIVKGVLAKEGSSVWIEDLETDQPVTEKVVKR